jgi:hypothetical protein
VAAHRQCSTHHIEQLLRKYIDQIERFERAPEESLLILP